MKPAGGFAHGASQRWCLLAETPEISLTPEQQVAVDEAVMCLSGDTENGLTIGGYAGTGKTVLIKSIVEGMAQQGKYIAVAAFTGKAVSVLRRKGVYRAQTLHSLMYKPDKVNGQLVFTKVISLECDGVIVDEASMINTSLYEDLLSFHIPLVFVGDHGQLEPIGDNPRIMERPDIKLEKIHRQAEGSAILWLAHLFREGKRPNWGTVTTPEIRTARRNEALLSCHRFDAVLCGFNKTRVAINARVRKNLGLDGDLTAGERLICLKNNRSGFFNGQMFKVTTVHGKKNAFLGPPFGSPECFEVDIENDDGTARKNVLVWLAPSDADLKDFPTRSEVVVCDYGYALTVHKSQGSEFEKVLVIEEIWREKWDEKRWKYTAVTRASKELVWVSP